jgi:hypothetical protein
MPPISHLIKDKYVPRSYNDYLMIAGIWAKTDKKYIMLNKRLFQDMQDAYLTTSVSRATCRRAPS